MSFSALELVATLADHRVLDVGQLEDLQPFVRQYKDAESLAKQLVEWGWLTAYQAEVVIAGHAPSLLFGDYRLLEPLGQGGMGQVFKAAHLRLGRIVALKMINAKSMRTTEKPDELVRRFQREAQAAAQLLHPNIVILFDYNEYSGTHFIAMEYVDGVDLSKMIQSQGPLPLPHACDFIRQAASGLQHAFEFGMVHRDIKPSNLLVTRPSMPTSRAKPGPGPKPGKEPKTTEPALPVRGTTGGVVKILDLGLVRFSETQDDQDTLSALTMQGTVIGTPDYIAPEQARDASRVDVRADLYSLGCTFYFLLTGRPPFPTGTSVEKLFKHQNEQPMPIETIRPGTPTQVIGIIQRLMSKRPESRFQTPADLADAITALSSDLLTGRAKSDGAGQLVAAAADIVQAERSQTQMTVPTQMFSADSLILPARKSSVLQGHKGYVTAVEYSPDGRMLATGGVDGHLRLWDVGMGKVTEKSLDQNHDLGEVHHLKFGTQALTLFAGSTAMDGHNWRWEWITPIQNVRERFVHDGYRTSCFATSPEGTTLAAGSASAVLLYDYQGRKPSILKGHVADVRALAYSHNGKRLYSAGVDKRIIMWEPNRMWGNQRATYQGHSDTVVSLSVSPDGSLLASASLDGTIRLWDASGESTEAVSVLTGHSNGVRLVRFTANGALLLSVADGGQVFLWDVMEQAKVREWQIDKAMMHSVAASPDCRYIATGLGNGEVAHYDLELIVGQEQPQVLQFA